MEFVVLAAGRGRRLRPLTDGIPKPMLPVGQKPLVGHVLDAATEAGASGFVVVVADEDGPVRDRFGDSYGGVPITYAEQSEPRGTADAVACASDHLDGPFVVLNGDNLYDPASLSSVVDSAPAIGVYRVDDPTEYGVISHDGSRVNDIVEKPADPPTDLANVGAYALPQLDRDDLVVPQSDRGEREFTDVLAQVLETNRVSPVEFDTWLDVGRAWELLAANERVISSKGGSIEGDVSPDAHVHGDVVVEDGATIRERSTVEGPAVVRAGATVGPGAYVRGTTYVGPGAHVGHGVEVKNSVVMAEASVGHLSYVGDSLVGREANLGAGTTVANLRHDDEAIDLTVKGERLSTGRRKFGTVVGHGAKTGINTSVHPGVTLSTGATTMPGETVEHDR
jgi:bifunctional UDP-N-acetylglucosamine pyrophosphorylase/glucosamine-1-phosphate N-acetyltransferase